MSGGGGGGGKKDQGIPVTDYFMSVQVGLCHGPIDSIFQLRVKEKQAWLGQLNGEGGIYVNQPELFGGNKKEGGVRGVLYIMPGTATQTLPPGLAARLGLAANDAPAGRHKATAWFVGGIANVGTMGGIISGISGAIFAMAGKYVGFGPGQNTWFGGGQAVGGPESVAGGGGWMWGTNNPYMPAWEITAFRRPVGLSFSTAAIPNTVVVPGKPAEGTFGNDNYVPAIPDQTFIWPDANPVHVIFECMTNQAWGMGASAQQFNMDMWEAAATTIFNEKFGISLQWTQQARIEDFVTEVADHIQAVIYVNPRNGLFEIKLIRFDYDPDALRHLGPEHCKATNIQRKALEETINEVIVTWTNPGTEEEETVTMQDIANIAMQGQIVSDSRNYYGIRNSKLAMEVAVRDLRSASTPLVSADIEIDRTAWDIKPGECVKLSWPDDGIDQLIMRVGKVDYGKPGDQKVKVALLEDIFSLSLASFYTPPSSSWQDPDRPPAPLVWHEIMTAPYALMARAGFPVGQDDYPAVAAMIFGASPVPGTNSFELSGPVMLPAGGEGWESLGSMVTAAHSFLSTPLVAEAVSILPDGFLGLAGAGEGPTVNGFVIIGKGADEAMEIALITDSDPDVGVTLRRGLLDTVPRPWPAGTQVWFVNDNSRLTDGTERTPGPVQYKMQTRTAAGLLEFDDTPLKTDTLTDRPYLPNRPANVKVNGSGFADVYYASPPTTVPVTWANRNRTIEDQVFYAWTDASVQPEEGQTTTVRIIDRDSGDVVEEFTGLPGTSYDIPFDAFNGIGGTRVVVTAVRDGLESLQAHGINVDVAGLPGYGNRYGDFYGGAE